MHVYGSQLAKMKKSIPAMKYVNMWNLGAILWKFDILSITAYVHCVNSVFSSFYFLHFSFSLDVFFMQVNGSQLAKMTFAISCILALVLIQGLLGVQSLSQLWDSMLHTHKSLSNILIIIHQKKIIFTE